MFSWAAPLAVISLFAILGNIPVRDVPAMNMVIAIFCLGMIIAGLICGIVALTKMSTYGRRGVLVPAIIGISINGLFLLFMTHSVVSALLTLPQQNQAQAVQNRLDKLQDESQAHLRKQLQTGQSDPATTTRLLRDYIAEMDASTAVLGGKDRQIVEAGANILRQAKPAIGAYHATLDDFVKAGGISPVGLDSREAIRQRRSLLDALAQANDDLDVAMQRMPAIIHADMLQRGFTTQNAERMAAAVTTNASLDLQILIRKSDRELIRNMREVLTLFDQLWGQWSLNEENAGQIILPDDASVARYGKLMDEIDRLSREQTHLQRQALERMELRKKAQP